MAIVCVGVGLAKVGPRTMTAEVSVSIHSRLATGSPARLSSGPVVSHDHMTDCRLASPSLWLKSTRSIKTKREAPSDKTTAESSCGWQRFA